MKGTLLLYLTCIVEYIIILAVIVISGKGLLLFLRKEEWAKKQKSKSKDSRIAL